MKETPQKKAIAMIEGATHAGSGWQSEAASTNFNAVGELSGWSGDWVAALSGAISGDAARAGAKALAQKKPKSLRLRTRQELFEAIHSRNIKKLTEALDSGLDPNFVERGGLQYYQSTLISPLGIAIYWGWGEGAEALVRRGADEGLARRSYVEQGAEKERAKREAELSESDDVTWKAIGDPAILRLALSTQKDEKIRRMAAACAVKAWELAEWLLDNGQHGELGLAEWALAERKALVRVASHKPKSTEDCQRLLGKIWKAMPEILDEGKEFRWGMAVSSNSVGLLRFFAENGVASPKTPMGEMIDSCFPKGGIGNAPTELLVAGSDTDEDEFGSIYAAGQPCLRAPLWAIAIASESLASLKLLGEIEGLAQSAIAHPATARVASYCVDLAVIKEAKRQGLPLAQCVDNGQTPAHLALESKIPDGQKKAWGALCPEWLSIKRGVRPPIEFLDEEEGRKVGTPIDLLRDASKTTRTTKGKKGDETERLIADLEAMALKTVLWEAKKAAAAQAPTAPSRAKRPAAKKTPPRRL